MKVQFEPTPNPATMKFILPVTVSKEAFDCPTAGDADRSPLAAKIFGFPWTASVFIGTDFITVTKHDWVDWNVLAQPLAGLIEEHLTRGEPVVSTAAPAARSPQDPQESDSPQVRRIKEILQKEIRPVVALDGGDILFNRYEDQIVYLQMRGSCAGCPSSSATLKDGVEVRLKEALPEIREVVAI